MEEKAKSSPAARQYVFIKVGFNMRSNIKSALVVECENDSEAVMLAARLHSDLQESCRLIVWDPYEDQLVFTFTLNTEGY